MPRILIATSNPGKLRDFAAVAAEFRIEVAPVPGLASLPSITEDAPDFDGNARKKAAHYSRFAPGEMVLADDSGLEVAALKGAPGVHSARFAAFEDGRAGNSTDAENKARLLRDLAQVPDARRAARFVCVIAAARDGRTLRTFRGEASGTILHAERGAGGFGYDPLFYVPGIEKTFAELTTEEKAAVSHRGRAFRNFLAWYRARVVKRET
jgi:XTP/dITP diphosphohydrolase